MPLTASSRKKTLRGIRIGFARRHQSLLELMGLSAHSASGGYLSSWRDDSDSGVERCEAICESNFPCA